MAPSTQNKARATQNKARAKTTKRRTRGRTKRPLVIDFHTHINVPEVLGFLKQSTARGKGPPPRVSKSSSAFQNRQYKIIMPKLTDPKVRLRDMDKAGIDIQVITAMLSHYCYWADGATGLRIAKLCNDRIAEIVDGAPDRFAGLATVPLQDTRRAVNELNRAVTRLGLKGVIISSRTETKELGDKSLRPFWAKAEALDVPVYIHPHGYDRTERMQDYFLWNSIAQPLEEAMAMASLIYSGTMERHPRLKVCFAHGGGYLPYYAGRMDRAFEIRPETRKNITRKPSAYIKRFYYDTCVYNPDMLEFLVGKVGAGHVVMGSDYPVFLKEDNPVGFVGKARGLTAKDRDGILGGNAARLLKLRV